MRDDKGRFVKGQSGNPSGRPRKEREEQFYEVAVNSVTFIQWRRIVEKAAWQAERGDTAARKWLSDYLMGTPVQRIEQSTHVTGDIIIDWSEITQAGGENTD